MLNTIIKISLISCIAALSIGSTIAKADTAAKFNCMLTDTMSGEKPGPQKMTFSTTTPEIFLVCDSDNVKKGEKVKSVWIATDTTNAAPANYQIDEKALDITEDANSDHVLNTKFSLSKPDKDWPAGTYRVELFVNNQLIETLKYDIS
jgi:hypothetical protein